MGIALSAQAKRALEEQGFLVERLPQGVADELPKATYYKKTGEAMPNLPADERSMRSYLRRGFTLEPPDHPIEEIEGQIKMRCAVCAFESDDRMALVEHMMTHTSIGG